MGLLGVSATPAFDHASFGVYHRGPPLKLILNMRLLFLRPQTDCGSSNIHLQP